MTEIDIIILSNALTEELKYVTVDSIHSLMNSEDPLKIKFNILVLESNLCIRDYNYQFSQTIYPSTPFGFHRYMNLGIGLTSAPYVCLCNNDLLFHKGWASAILKNMDEIPDLFSASPICSIYHPAIGIPINSGVKIGYRVGVEIAGWCLFLKRETFQTIGELDENYVFNASDLDYSTTLEVLNLKHALITSSIVDHLRSKTLNIHNKQIRNELKQGKAYYDRKWAHRILAWRNFKV